MKKIVLLGGTFDPIHYGHLEMMKAAIKQTHADEGWFVLAGQAPLKDDKQLSFETRASLIEIMIKPYSHLKLCDIENTLPQPNYTVNTVKALQIKYPTYQFQWLIGSDQAAQFEQWKDYQYLLDYIEMLVYKREGSVSTSMFTVIEGKPLSVSSTEIRKGLSTMTHPHILYRIITEGLYTQEMLSHYLKPARVKHSKEVAKLMGEFARHYQLDESYYYGLGMIHDLCKELEKQGNLDHLLTPYERKLPAYTHHAYACRNLLAWHYKIKDRKFTDAIKHHVLGTGHTIEAMLLYVSDKCERTRGYDSEPLIKLTKQNVYEGFKATKRVAADYQKEKGVIL